jgi:hypothetical protein
MADWRKFLWEMMVMLASILLTVRFRPTAFSLLHRDEAVFF